jgi:hypothetical protein
MFKAFALLMLIFGINPDGDVAPISEFDNHGQAVKYESTRMAVGIILVIADDIQDF